MGVISLLEFFNISKKIMKNNLIQTSSNLFFIIYMFSFCYMFFFLSNFPQLKLLLFLLLFGCIGSDIGGYIIGKLVKGPKLTKLSPNKTYAGMMGSFLFSILCTIIYFDNLTLLSLSYPKIEMGIQIMFIVLSTSFVSQVGDLTISFFKRRSKIKNTGKIIPGHGGILDRIDGMIFAFPYAFLLTKII